MGEGGRGTHEQVTKSFIRTLADIDKKGELQQSLNQGLIFKCRQFLDVYIYRYIYGTLNIVLHLDRKTHRRKHMPTLKSEISGTFVNSGL